MSIENERNKCVFSFTESIFPGVEITAELKSVMASCISQFQKVQIIQTTFGKTLITDGKTQSTQMDEFIYHESLVHPSLLKCALSGQDQDQGPRSVFIGGGGELATAREVLRHKSVERIVMVDLDEKVIELCRKHLPEWGGDKVANNPRMELIVGDAYAYLNNCQEKFDVIIMDISDPIEAGPGILLYTQEFYQHAKHLLRENGVFVTQGGIADGGIQLDGIKPGSDEDFSSYAAIANTLNTVFDCVAPYSLNIPSFGSDWGFVMAFDTSSSDNASDADANANAISDVANIPPNTIDAIIDSHITEIDDIECNAGECKPGCDVLKYYDGLSHRRMFSLPKVLRKNMKMDTRVMTKDNPVFMY